MRWATPRRLSILVDLDGVVADLHPAWHERALTCCGPAERRTLEETLSRWDGFLDLPCGDHVFDHLTPEMFLGLAPLPGALEALKSLGERHEVTIVTASAKDPHTAGAKLDWVARHLGWDRHHVIVAQRKELVRGDVFIDDAPKNLNAWRLRNEGGFAITIDYPYNRGAAVDFRAVGWRDTAAAWAEICEVVTELEVAR